jgi:UDP-N-acetylglucosamine:LPS N-acetylglucosamine transferase
MATVFNPVFDQTQWGAKAHFHNFGSAEIHLKKKIKISEEKENAPDPIETSLGFSLPTALQGRLKKEGRPLRIEILECSGGEGHKKSADAVQNAVKNHFDKMGIQVEFKRKDVGSHMAPDPLGKMTFGKYKMIDLHNTLARHGKIGLIRLLMKIGKLIHKIYFPFNVQYFNRRYESKAQKLASPDLIISAVPMVNGPLLLSVKEKNIPVMVVTTDPDNELFSVNWPTDKDLSPHRYCIPYNALEIAEKVNSAVDISKIRGIGYPVRAEFLKTYSKDELEKLRLELNIEPNVKHIGVMMGGLGGVVTLNYFKKLAEGINENKLIYDDSHFSFFCGTNHDMESTLEQKAISARFKVVEGIKGEAKKMLHPSGVSISIVGYTKNVHKYMAVSQCWVTKPGSASFFECLGMGVPMLIDNTGEPLPWEDLNIEIQDTYNFGEKVTDFQLFIDQLNTILEPEKNKVYHEAMVEYRADRPVQNNFGENIVKITYELLKEAEEVKLDKQVKAEQLKLLVTEKQKAQTDKNEVSIVEWIKGVGRQIAVVAKMIYEIAVAIIFLPLIFIDWGIKWLIKAIVDLTYFSGFGMNQSMKAKRRKELIKGIRKNEQGEKYFSPHKAKPIEGSTVPFYSSVSKLPIDALEIKSTAKERTGNAIIFVLGKEYQGLNPRNFDHLLDDGADVILFNPSRNTAQVMASDLKTLIAELQKRNPEQKILLHGYSIGAHVATSVACDLAMHADPRKQVSLPVIVDRGYGDGYSIAKKTTVISKIPYAKKYINKYYNNGTLEKIQNHKHKMLFLSPTEGDDQIMHMYEGKKIINFTKNLHINHKNADDRFIELKNADHWTQWTYDVHNKVKEFLKDQNIIRRDYKKFDEKDTGGFPAKTTVPWFRRHLLPLFV